MSTTSPAVLLVAILRPARTPRGTEVRTVIKHLTKRIRSHWPTTHLIWRGDSHYGRDEALAWAESNGAGYIFAFAGNSVLDGLVAETAQTLRFRHALSTEDKMRCYASFEYQAKSWSKPRRIVARLVPATGPHAVRGRFAEVARSVADDEDLFGTGVTWDLP